MVTKKSIFYVLVVSGLFGAFHARAMEALGDRNLQAELVERLAGLRCHPEMQASQERVGAMAGEGLTRARSKSDSDLPAMTSVHVLVPFSLAHSIDGWYDDRGLACSEGDVAEDSALMLPADLPSQAVHAPSIGRRAGRAVEAYLKKMITEKPKLTRAGRSDSDPTPFSPFVALKKQVDACQKNLREKERELREAAQEANDCFEAELAAQEDAGLRKARCDAVAKREQLEREVGDLRREFEEIAAMKFRVNFALVS